MVEAVMQYEKNDISLLNPKYLQNGMVPALIWNILYRSVGGENAKI